MSDFQKLEPELLEKVREELTARFERFKGKRLKLDMTRGKPCPEQLDLANDLMNCLEAPYASADGIDCRNYGGLDGIPEAKQLFAEFFGISANEVLIGGNASLQLMHSTVSSAYSHGFAESISPWCKLPKVKALCPSPGYDRHFRISEHFGMELITVDMNDEGPDMDQVERLVAEDESIKLIWLVPRYGNPTGVTFSDSVVDRLARMNVKAKDFRIIWDDAYAVHHLDENPQPLKNILQACTAAGCPERVFLYGSTSKITFAGAGISFMGGSTKNIEWMKSHLFVETIGPDKLNILRHTTFLKNMAGIQAHMRKHAKILKPKFDAVLTTLDEELGGKNVATWTRPRGGYFVSLDTLEGCASKVVAMAKDAGVLLTQAGATFPYGKDPKDQNIRLAPSYPSFEDVRQAMEIVAVCVQLVSIDTLLVRK